MDKVNFGWWLQFNIGGEVARDIDALMELVHWFMLALFVGWGAFFVYCLVRFRSRSGHKADPRVIKAKPSKYLEVGVVVFEVVLLVWFSIPVWGMIKTEIPQGSDVVKLRCIARQFNWNFHYAGADGIYGRTDVHLMDSENFIGLDHSDPHAKDDIVTQNQLHFPVNTHVVMDSSSTDVIHCFWIPALRVKQDLVPGMGVPIWFIATQTTDTVRDALTREYPLDERFERLKGRMIVRQNYNQADGTPVMKVGDGFFSDEVERLKAAGINTVSAAPRYPVEVACAQLCGNQHYDMQGFVTIHETRAEFDAWLAEQVDAGGDEEEEEEEE